MVSSNGAQSLDPLGTIVGNITTTTNNNQYFNEILINSVNDKISQEMVLQNPSRSFSLINNYARSHSHTNMESISNNDHVSPINTAAIEDFLARSSASGGGAIVGESQPLDDQWLLHYQMSVVQAAQSHREEEERQIVAAAAASYGGGAGKFETAESFGEVCVGGYNDDNVEAEENGSEVIGCCVAPADSAAEKRRRSSEDLREKSVERRQKRMIKNRESAARSRARKQAYTNNLEQRLRGLREMNDWLKLKKEMVTQIMATTRTNEPNKAQAQLWRTSSANF